MQSEQSIVQAMIQAEIQATKGALIGVREQERQKALPKVEGQHMWHQEHMGQH